MREEDLHKLAIRMPIEKSYQIVIEFIKSGRKSLKELRDLSFRMPTEESYREVHNFYLSEASA